MFKPIAVETLGVFNASAIRLLNGLGRRISSVSGDTRETSHLFQQVSVLVQRFNAVLLHDSLPVLDYTDWASYPFSYFHQFLKPPSRIDTEDLKNNNNNNKIGKSILLSTWVNMHCCWSNDTNILNGQRQENKNVPSPSAFQHHSRSSLVTSRWIRSNYWPTSYTVSKIKGNFGRETQICRSLYLNPPLRVLCNGVWVQKKLVICHYVLVLKFILVFSVTRDDVERNGIINTALE